MTTATHDLQPGNLVRARGRECVVQAQTNALIAASAADQCSPRVCSLGQITHALFEVGGQYRRNM